MRKKVMLVDDSVLVLRIASAYLRDRYEVITEASGEEALADTATQRPDVIVMDLNMSGRSGIEVADLLSRDRRTSDIPIVIMTTSSEVRLLPSHFDRVTKPFDKGTLLAKIAERLQEPSSS